MVTCSERREPGSLSHKVHKLKTWEDASKLFLGINFDWTVILAVSRPRINLTSLAPTLPDNSEFRLHSSNSFGMLTDETPTAKKSNIVPKKSAPKPSRRYVSKHFRQNKVKGCHNDEKKPAASPAPATLNIDALSSDSTLTDVPSDIGPDPFVREQITPVRAKVVKIKRPTRSPYFPNKPRPQFLSCLPFPPLSDTSFGLMQEKLAHDPFRLLVATIFLNKTPGERAMPVFYQLMKMYPTVQNLANAEIEDVTAIIYPLGFQNQRARKCVQLAKKWFQCPPIRGQRTRKLHYPQKGNGRDIGPEEVIADNDPRVAWEISHLPGLGPYSHDSWRMFCRDELRGLSESWLGEGATELDFEPEWKRVIPTDKELRAYLTWLWLKEGWTWNKETGERIKADEKTLLEAQGGGVVQEESDKQHLVVKAGAQGLPAEAEKPAGDFIPSPVPVDHGTLNTHMSTRIRSH